jgi:hypothetical protein
MKKCPPGVICLENVTLIIILFCFLILFYLIYTHSGKNILSEKIIINNDRNNNNDWNYPPNDPLINPYNPPLSDEHYIMSSGIPRGAVPINVSTNPGAVDTIYRQIGILTPTKGGTKDNILPLMGRPLFTNRDMWNYYTSSNQYNNVKLPLSKRGRSCTNEYGCDRLYTNDTVDVEGLNETYKVTIYDNNIMKYLPFV